MNEASGGETPSGEQSFDAALRVLAWHEQELAFIFTRLDADSPERVEIDFHPVAPRVRGERNEMREAFFPESRLARKIRPNGVTRAKRACTPRPPLIFHNLPPHA